MSGMKLCLALLLIAAPVHAAQPQLLVFGPARTQTSFEGLNIRSTGSTGFTLLEHGRSSDLAPGTVTAAPVSAQSAARPEQLLPRAVHADVVAPAPVTPVTGYTSLAAAPVRLKPSQQLRREALSSVVRAAADRHRLPHGLVDAVILAESRYEPHAVSHAGAAGMMQLMPGTAADLGVRDRFNPMANIEAGSRYLRQMIDTMGSVRLGVAAYNAGIGSVRRARGVPNNGETPTYVNRVLGFWSALSSTAGASQQPFDPAPTLPPPAQPPIRPGIEMISFAGTKLATLVPDRPYQSSDAAK